MSIAVVACVAGCYDTQKTPMSTSPATGTNRNEHSADSTTATAVDDDTSPSTNKENSTVPMAEEQAFTFEGDAVELGKEFAKDRDAARAKYDGKQVIVEGTIRERYHDHRDRNYLVIAGVESDRNTWTHAHFAPGNGYDALNSLPGRSVKLKADFYRHAGVVGLDDAEILELGPQPAEIVTKTVDEFAQEFESDIDSGIKKYKQSPILLEGIVSSIDGNDVLLRGENDKNPSYVVAQFSYHPNFGSHEIATLSEGMKIKVLADDRGNFANFDNVRPWYGDEFADANPQVTLIGARLWLDKDNDPILKGNGSD